MKFRLTWHCSDSFIFRIKSLTQNVTVDEGGLAEFRCEIEANPFDDKTITWELPDHPYLKLGNRPRINPNLIDWRDRSDISVDMHEKTSILRLRGIDRFDTGRVLCKASNGVKDDMKVGATALVVNRKLNHIIHDFILKKWLLSDPPYIDRSPAFTKMAVSRGGPAFLTCRASGVPRVSFAWFIQRGPEAEMKRVDISHRDRGESVDPPERVFGPAFTTATYDSVLVLDNVRSEHYHTKFRCEAANKYGVASHTMELVKPGAPDMPKNVEVNTVINSHYILYNDCEIRSLLLMIRGYRWLGSPDSMVDLIKRLTSASWTIELEVRCSS